MNRLKSAPRWKERTPVDDVRRVRQKLSQAMSHDINRLADHARTTTEKLRRELGLKPARRS